MFIPVGVALQRLLEVMGWSEKTSAIFHFWEKELGGLAPLAPLVGIRKGRLYVQAESSVVRQELTLRQRELLKNLNQHIGDKKLKEIKFVFAGEIK